jgi:hypothetical protein
MDLRANSNCFPERTESNDYFDGDEMSRVREELNFLKYYLSKVNALNKTIIHQPDRQSTYRRNINL